MTFIHHPSADSDVALLYHRGFAGGMKEERRQTLLAVVGPRFCIALFLLDFSVGRYRALFCCDNASCHGMALFLLGFLKSVIGRYFEAITLRTEA